jgi:hypothetical protein
MNVELSIQEIVEDQGKKAITYDDILARMNMQIVNGRLQYLAPSAIKSTKPNEMHNKYFSKEVKPTVPIFKTREEYQRHLFNKKVEAIIAHKRSKIGRSTKLLFYNQYNHLGSQSGATNKLFNLIKK